MDQNNDAISQHYTNYISAEWLTLLDISYLYIWMHDRYSQYISCESIVMLMKKTLIIRRRWGLLNTRKYESIVMLMKKTLIIRRRWWLLNTRKYGKNTVKKCWHIFIRWMKHNKMDRSTVHKLSSNNLEIHPPITDFYKVKYSVTSW